MGIIALLLGMLMVPLSTQIDQQRYAETQRQLDMIREAIIGFAIANGRLPCPATPTLATSGGAAGVEARTTACNVPTTIVEGVVPWLTLGVPETDAWGRRFTYRVTSVFADDATGGASATFVITDSGDITVKTRIDATLVDISTNVPAIVVSHGKNGAGGYQPDGSRITPTATGDEAENSNANATFVSKFITTDFDDVVVWVSGNVLKSRMVAGGRLP